MTFDMTTARRLVKGQAMTFTTFENTFGSYALATTRHYMCFDIAHRHVQTEEPVLYVLDDDAFSTWLAMHRPEYVDIWEAARVVEAAGFDGT